MIPTTQGGFPMFQTKLVVLAVVSFVVSFSQLFGRTVVYFNDFESAVGTEWSNRTRSITPIGGRRFLGRFPTQKVSLALNDLPPHTQVTLIFDLFIILTMDGNAPGHPEWGPDIWDLSIKNGATLLHTTFSNIDGDWNLTFNQAYPDNYPGGSYPPLSQANEIDTLGYIATTREGSFLNDSVYHLNFNFAHSTESLTLDFSSQFIENGIHYNINNESWGVDNVKVELITENLSPQITHTPITSAIQNQNIKVDFEAKDLDGVLSSVELFYRVTGASDYQSVGMSPAQSQTQFTLEIPANAVTLAGVDYYIEAKDAEGLVGTSGTAQNPHHICITDSNKKIPTIIIHGILGCELNDAETGDTVWLDPGQAMDPTDLWLLQLTLKENGEDADANSRCLIETGECHIGTGSGCPIDWSHICNDAIKCPSPLDPCVTGGRKITKGNFINIQGCCFIEGYTAYRDLVDYLSKNEYIFKKDVFLYSYDWRLDLDKTAETLRSEFIDKLAPNSCDKVNIIAHSMGGLVVRNYINKYLDDHRLDKVIYLSVPHIGSPKAYAILKYFTKLMDDKKLFLDSINSNTLSFVSQNCPGIYELLPRYSFIVNEGLGAEAIEESYKNLSNSSLTEKAKGFHESIKNLAPIEKSYSINGSGQATLSSFLVEKKGCMWAYSGQGDGTVPARSITGFPTTKSYFVNGEHHILPGILAVQKKILKILQGKENDPDDPNEVRTTPFELGETWRWTSCCPINLEITDLENNVNGVDKEVGDIRQEISGSGFFSFPNNESGFMPHDNEYNIKIKAFKNGEFTLIFNLVEPDETISKTIEYANVPIGEKSLGELLLTSGNNNPILSLDIRGDGTPDFELVPNTDIPIELKNMFAKRGDVNRDGDTDISDGINILEFLFLGSKVDCAKAGDTNKDGTMDISDAIYLLSFLFLGWEEVPQENVLCE